MKILLVVHLFLPDYFSGTEILTLNTALELQSRGHQVQILTGYPAQADMPDSERFDDYEYQGLKVTRFRHTHTPMGNQDNIAEQEYDNHLLAARFTRLVQEFQPGVVHFFHLMRISASAIDICWHQGLPTVFTPTDFWFVCPTSQLRLPDGAMCAGPDRLSANCVRHLAALKKPGPITQILHRVPQPVLMGIVQLATWPPFKYLKPFNLAAATSARKDFLKKRINRINKVLIPTRVMHEALIRQGLDPARVQRCGYGIKLPVVSLTDRHPLRPLTLGVIGLGEHKGAHVAIQAIRQRPGLNLVLQIYGRPSDFPDYAEQLRTLANGDRRVQFCGTFANDKIGDILALMDVLVVPSLWFENAPLVIFCAQAAGVPVIGSDMAGIAESITDKDNGRLFPAGDAHRLAEIVTELALDQAQITRMSKRARMPKTIAAYTDELVAVYGELVADKGGNE
ncbi:MAG: glycosyltransferase [Rhodoferax sp.]|uniref:glycosyltransferase n=1 Tax=Rhodoferax sp. TaxID=50421 RepID=UPI003BB54886